jgi:hypothetical protein
MVFEIFLDSVLVVSWQSEVIAESCTAKVARGFQINHFGPLYLPALLLRGRYMGKIRGSLTPLLFSHSNHKVDEK